MNNRRGYVCVIKLRREEIQYDVDFISWKLANCRVADSEKERSERQTDEESRDWIGRQIETAFDTVISKIRAYVAGIKSRVSSNSKDGNVDEWNLELVMEPGWRGEPKQLCTYMHNYVVAYVLAKWFGITLPSEAANYVQEYSDWMDKIVSEARNVQVKNVSFRL